MPAWWKGKLKSKCNSRKKDDDSRENKEKANSFDEALIIVNRKSIDRSLVHRGPSVSCTDSTGPALAHPLPRPLSSPLPTIPQEPVTAPTSTSMSESSVSSSGSDEAPDLSLCRYQDQITTTPRRTRTVPIPNNNHHNVSKHRHLSVSPRKEFSSNFFELGGVPTTNGRKSMEAVLVHHKPGPSSLAHPLPLPLPPGLKGHLQSQWRKGKLLGRGTFGHVYLGFNSESGQMCAIKEVSVISDDSNSTESLKQLNQEISLLSHLKHPNIVQYYGSELMEETLSVYLEYVSGGSIHKLLKEYGPFRESVIRNYTAQILSGLAFLHSKNTLHRDIKGANILVDPNGDIKLADFGMAKHISSYTSIKSFKGSPYWMAPEIIMNASGYNLSVDIWSLGCTVLEMATSKPPWSQFEGVQAIFKIGNSKDIPDIPENLSFEGKNFVRMCLQRDPSARPTALQLLDHPFVRDSVSRTSPFQPTMELSSRRIFHSPIHSTQRATPNEQFKTRANLSLPVSPCASPLRKMKNTNNHNNNRSCLPSPPHPAFSAGAINYSPINNSLYPQRPVKGFTLTDPFVQLRLDNNSPRRL